MTFWYTIDIPRTRPCAEVNPNLWKNFKELYRQHIGKTPVQTELFTEEAVVQWLDQNITVSNYGEHEN